MRKIEKNFKAFTLVELIIVITILVILSTISFVAYQDSLTEARNSVRISDMSNIKMSLKNHKLKNGGYPIPGDYFDITNSGTIIKQGFLNENVATQELVNKPNDPLVEGKYYTYSITNNKLFFQVAMSIENESLDTEYLMNAYVDGDYQQILDIAPSIVFASTSSGTIDTLSGSFIVDKGTLNLPYDEGGNTVKTATSLSGIIDEAGVVIPKFYGYYSCAEIYENGASMGSGTYKILESSGSITNTGCLMDY